MKIIGFEAENIKRIKCVNIKPDGNLVVIGGKNGQGKTSVLDSIWWALEGTRNIQDKPIRDGATTAHIRLDMGELIVERTFKPGKEEGKITSSIRVSSPDGALFQSPQKMLDELLGSLSFDPLAFSRMKPREQFDTLRVFVPEIDFDQIEAQNAMDFDRRTNINRDMKQARAAAAEIDVDTSNAKEFITIDESALADSLSDAMSFNQGIENTRRELATDYEKAATYRSQASILRQRAAELEQTATEIDETIAASPPLPAPKNVDEIRSQMDTAREFNQTVRLAEEKLRHEARADDLKIESDLLTHSIVKRNEEKEAKIAAAKMPFDGISFGDGEILLDGQPFEQGSDAEQLRASIAMAMAMNSKLQVIRVRDGSLLDEDSMLTLEEMADKYDCQVWIERVGKGDGMGFILEDGEIAGEGYDNDPDGLEPAARFIRDQTKKHKEN